MALRPGLARLGPFAHRGLAGAAFGETDTRVLSWGGDGDLIVHWQDKVGETSSPLTVAGQGEPENQWEVHPLIDGCAPKDSGDGGNGLH